MKNLMTVKENKVSFLPSISENKNLYWLVGISAIIRIILAVNALSDGEAYYARGAYDLQLSYFDQPPLFFWLSGGLIKIFGLSNLTLRLPSILFFALSSILLYKITDKIYNNKKAAFYTTLLYNVSPVFSLAFGVFFQPDSTLLFFWLLSFYALYEILFPDFEIDSISNYRKSKHVFKWFLILGITIGLSALSKYYVVFIVFGVLLFLLIKKNHRHWFSHYGFYMAVLISIILFLPVLLWNQEQDWISFTFQSSRAGSDQQSLRFDWLLRSIGGQALYVLPWIWIPLIIQIPIIYKTKFKKEIHHLILFLALPVIFFFTIITLWSNLQFHFHWQTPGYLLLYIPLGNWLVKMIDLGYEKIIKRTINGMISVTMILFVLLIVHINTGSWTFYGPRWLATTFGESYDPTILINDFDAVKETYEKNGWLSDDNIFAGGTRWWLCGLLDYSLKYEKDFLVFNKDPRNYAYLSDPVSLIGKDCVVPSNYQDLVDNDVRPFFDKVELVDSCWIERWEGEHELKIYFYYCHNFHLPERSMKHLPIYAQMYGLSPFHFNVNPIEEENIWHKENNVYTTDFEYKNEHARSLKIIKDPSANSGKFSCKMTKEFCFGADFYFHMKVTDSSHVFLVTHMKSKDLTELTNYHQVSAMDKIIPNGSWQEVNVVLNLDKEKQVDSQFISIFPWLNDSKGDPVFIDDIRYEISYYE